MPKNLIELTEELTIIEEEIGKVSRHLSEYIIKLTDLQKDKEALTLLIKKEEN